jgi:hypothetical protein
VADLPDTLAFERHRDLEPRSTGLWARRAIFGLIAAISVLGLANVFGQRPATVTVDAPAASLKLYAPERLRGGLLFMARFHVFAHEDLEHATLVLDPGWAEAITINTIAPSPVSETSRDGRLVFDLGPIRAGRSYILFMDFQVNPTNVGRRSQDVDLLDGDVPILHIDRTVTIFP